MIDVLADAAARGVKVRIWRESSTVGLGEAAEIAKLAAAGVELRVKPTGDLVVSQFAELIFSACLRAFIIYCATATSRRMPL